MARLLFAAAFVKTNMQHKYGSLRHKVETPPRTGKWHCGDAVHRAGMGSGEWSLPALDLEDQINQVVISRRSGTR
jgi:hypothetical protein